MSFDVRCPDCKARLRLDEEPDPKVEIECPRCEASFLPPKAASQKPQEKPKAEKPKGDKPKKKEGKKGATSGKKREVRKKRTNPVVLLIAIGFGFLFLFGVCMAMLWFMNRPGKVLDMMSYVSADSNYVRGLNLTVWNKYPGYASEVGKFYTQEVKAATDAMADAVGADKETFIDYMLTAKIRNGGTSTMYVFRTYKPFNMEKLGTGLPNGRPNGTNMYAMAGNAPGILANSTVYIPSKKDIVVILPGRQSAKMLSDAQAGKDSSFAKHFNDTVRISSRSASWVVFRNTGDLQTFIANGGASLKDLPGIVDRMKATNTAAVWCNPGASGMRVSCGLECATSAEAGDFVKGMKGGPLGKGDESEPTNDMKAASLGPVTDKKAFSEFMQYCTFTSNGACAYLYSTVSSDASVRSWMGKFNDANLGAGN